MTSKSNLSGTEIEKLFKFHTRPGVGSITSGGKLYGKLIKPTAPPLGFNANTPTLSSYNTNLEPNQYGVTRTDNKATMNRARAEYMSKNQKVKGAMASGSGVSGSGVSGSGVSGGQNTNYNEPRDSAGLQKPNRKREVNLLSYGGKASLKKEVGASNKLKWTDFVKAVHQQVPDLRFGDALKIASIMKKSNQYRLSDVNDVNVSTAYSKL